MVRALLAIVSVLRRAWLVELAGAALIVTGVTVGYGKAAGAVAAGVALLLKAFELDDKAAQ